MINTERRYLFYINTVETFQGVEIYCYQINVKAGGRC